MMPPVKGKSKRASVILRVRVPPERAKFVRRLAREQHKTESDVLREAIDMLDIRARREKATKMLIDLIPDKVPTKEEYAARFGKW
ncbi:MAG: hypothetical protein WDA16_00745 [Candidatus Thermoplasmatota archaeon]